MHDARCSRRIRRAMVMAVALPWFAVAPLSAQPAVADPAGPLWLEQAISQLESDDWVLQWEAMQTLSRLGGDQAIDALQRLLRGDGSSWVRGRALVALARVQGGRAFDLAMQHARGRDADLRAAGIEALGIIGSPRGESVILEAVQEPPGPVQFQAIEAYARVRGDHAWPFITAGLRSENPQLLRSAIRALTHIDTPRARARLMELLDSDNATIAVETAMALGKLQLSEAIAPLLRLMSTSESADVRATAEQALAAFSAEALATPLLEALSREEGEAQQAAMRLLSQRPTPRVAERIASLAHQGDERFEPVLAMALDLLARLDARAYRAVFTANLRHAAAPVRARAVQHLAAGGGHDLFPLLRERLDDEDESVRALVFDSLREASDARLPDGIVNYLRPVLQRGHEADLQPAIQLLRERLTAAEAPAALRELDRVLGGGDDDLRTLAASTVARVGTEAVKRQTAATQGYLTHWLVVGPFSLGPKDAGLQHAFEPQQWIDLEKPYTVNERTLRWRPSQAETEEGTVMPGRVLEPTADEASTYALSDVAVARRQPMKLTVTANDAFIVWVNGRQLAEEDQAGSAEIEAVLEPGRNRILLKLVKTQRDWTFSVRLTDADGRRLEGLNLLTKER